MPPALILLVDAAIDAGELGAALDTARRTGGVARVLLFHPPDIESDLARRTLGFRLWPLDGATAGQRFANAFRQAVELGYDGGIVLHGPAGHRLDPDVITRATAALEELVGAIVADGDGGIALLALQQAEPALLAGDAVPTYDDVVRRAAQLRVRLLELSSSSASQPGR